MRGEYLTLNIKGNRRGRVGLNFVPARIRMQTKMGTQNAKDRWLVWKKGARNVAKTTSALIASRGQGIKNGEIPMTNKRWKPKTFALSGARPVGGTGGDAKQHFADQQHKKVGERKARGMEGETRNAKEAVRHALICCGPKEGVNRSTTYSNWERANKHPEGGKEISESGKQ